MLQRTLVCVLLGLCLFELAATSLITDPLVAARWLVMYNQEAQQLLQDSVGARWNVSVAITPENSRIAEQKSKNYAEFSKKARKIAAKFDWRHFNDTLMRRSFAIISSPGIAILPPKDYDEYMQLSSEMQRIYSEGAICKDGQHSFRLDPELSEIMATSRDYGQLLWAWKGWRDAVGPPMRNKYRRFVELLNKAARLGNKTDMSVSWKADFAHSGEPKYNFEDDITRIFNHLKPLYAKLHNFVRAKLKDFYGSHNFPSTGHIPAHLLGNMWAQSWANIEPILISKTASDSTDATPALQNITVHDMFKISEDFFLSLGLSPMPGTFWTRSMFTRPSGKEVVCHGSAFDSDDGKDFRIKMCTQKTMEDLNTIHHEMGHVEYYLQYSGVPLLFRRGANSGFHEAIGDLIVISVSNPRHLKKLGLLKDVLLDKDTEMAHLLRMALNKVALLPFSKLMDDWRWNVFNGSISSNDYTKSWWKLRCQYQGVSPPVARSENDFDPGAKYHVSSNTPYARYFVATVLQFQFHRSLCKAAGHTGPLHTCDIYGSKAAGDKLRRMMRLGALKPWHEALKVMTDSETMDPSAMTEYFQPLVDWLDSQQTSDRSSAGWSDECPEPLPSAAVPPVTCLPPAEPLTSKRSQQLWDEPSLMEEYWKLKAYDEDYEEL